jgi:hypothetical protein
LLAGATLAPLDLAPASRKLLDSTGRVYISVKQRGIGGGRPARQRRAYSIGGSPTKSLNAELNDPRLRNPTSRLIAVTIRSVSRSSSIARSIRCRWRYLWGVSPKARLKLRLKCAGEA